MKYHYKENSMMTINKINKIFVYGLELFVLNISNVFLRSIFNYLEDGNIVFMLILSHTKYLNQPTQTNTHTHTAVTVNYTCKEIVTLNSSSITLNYTHTHTKFTYNTK